MTIIFNKPTINSRSDLTQGFTAGAEPPLLSSIYDVQSFSGESRTGIGPDRPPFDIQSWTQAAASTWNYLPASNTFNPTDENFIYTDERLATSITFAANSVLTYSTAGIPSIDGVRVSLRYSTFFNDTTRIGYRGDGGLQVQVQHTPGGFWTVIATLPSVPTPGTHEAGDVVIANDGQSLTIAGDGGLVDAVVMETRGIFGLRLIPKIDTSVSGYQFSGVAVHITRLKVEARISRVWHYLATGSTPSGGTGPGKNNTSPFVALESSGLSLANINQVGGLVYRGNLQGGTLDLVLEEAMLSRREGWSATGGVRVQSRNAIGEWRDVAIWRGSAYADDYVNGTSIRDDAGVAYLSAALGGWRRRELSIPKCFGLRFVPMATGGVAFHHDWAIRSIVLDADIGFVPGPSRLVPPSLNFFIRVVATYDVGNPVYYTDELSRLPVPLGRQMPVAPSLTWSIDAYQSIAALVQIGELTLSIDAAADPRWLPVTGYLQHPRDHELTIENRQGQTIWAGRQVSVRMSQPEGTAQYRFEHLYNRLNEVQVSGSGVDDADAVAVPAQEIWDEVRRDFNALPTADLSAFADVFRPKEAVKARSYLGRMLAGARYCIYVDFEGILQLAAITPRVRPLPQNYPLITDSDLLGNNGITIKDHLEKLFTAIKYEPFNGDEREYTGDLSRFTPTGAALVQYGYREYRIDLRHLSATDAAAAAAVWHTELFLPKRRCSVTIDLEKDGVFDALSVVRLALDHVQNVALAYGGYFMVVGASIDVVNQTRRLDLLEVDLGIAFTASPFVMG